MELNRRNTFRGTINRIRDFTNDAVLFEAASIVGLNERLDSLKSAFEKLTVEHLKLVEAAADQAAVDVHNDFYAAVEENYTDSAIKIRERIAVLENLARQNNAQANQANNNANANANNNQQIVQVAAAPEIPLERLKLSTFNGDHDKWGEWISMYNSLVHNKNYADTEKFHYMKTALVGAAAETIGGWNVTGENYQAAYDSLVELYDNKYRITVALLDELFKLEKQKDENYESLRMLINTVNRSTRQLTVVGCPALGSHFGTLFAQSYAKVYSKTLGKNA